MKTIKIAYTSDLHYPTTAKDVIVQFVKQLKKINPDILIIGGDIAEGSTNLDTCLKLFSDLDCTKMAVAGNHDLWTVNGITSDVAWDLFPTICKDNGFLYLEDENFILGNIAFVGSYLHYDYSAKDTKNPVTMMNDEWYGINKINFNNDARFLMGLPDDIDFSRKISNKFVDRLRKAQEDENVKKIVIATHVPCLESQIVRKSNSPQWCISNAYFGMLTHEKEILKTTKVSHVISGHSHQDVRQTINGHDKNGVPCERKISVFVNPSNYGSPVATVFDMEIS